ncbi:DNA topoisomerase 2-like [Quercus lobata]|uniref:DNA topoisomerase 2-like n=1 Tax=Quercus lobata TaxID=97700 RepID=UPI001245F34A|nr:DNA topoisomerase 2-like [Quercus lobata]
MRGKARGEAAMKSTRQAPRNPRKNNNKKANNAESVAEAVSSSMAAMEIEKAPEAAKPKGREVSRKAPAKPKKPTLVLNNDDDDDDDDVLKIKERLAAYNVDSSPDQSAAMETEVPKVPAKKKEPSKRAAAAQKKKPLATVSEISNDDVDDNDINEIDDDDDEDSEIEVVAAPEARKEGGRNPAANAKAVKAPAAAKKRGAANKQQPQTLGQKLLTDMLKPAENSEISPEKKVRKMWASPFNKKSGSVLGRVGKVNEVTENEENSGSASTSASTEETIEVAPARARPQRVNRAETRFRFLMARQVNG